MFSPEAFTNKLQSAQTGRVRVVLLAGDPISPTSLRQWSQVQSSATAPGWLGRIAKEF